MKNKSAAFTVIELLVCLAVLFLLIGAIVSPFLLGTGSFGPTRTQEVTVNRLYVDHSGSGDSSKSSYMVGTDQGVFEVDNGMFLGVYNADELYSRLREGRRYRITTEGNKVVNFMFQEYPYITAVQELELEKK